MKKTLLIYESKYGSTRSAVEAIAMVIGNARVCRVDESNPQDHNYDLIVLASPVYGGKLADSMECFVEQNEKWLRQKPLALVCVCLDPADGERCLEQYRERFRNKIISLGVLGGRLNLEELDDTDADTMKQFAAKTGYPLASVDRFRIEEVIDYALKLKDIRDNMTSGMSRKDVLREAEEFLRAHNTCTLGTSYEGRVRGTPIEYKYNAGYIYMLSEGGIKFANILLNPVVSICIYESYRGMKSLAGMQMSGTAEVFGPDHPEYGDVVRQMGKDAKILNQLPVQINAIRIKLEKVEYLSSRLTEKGYGVHQSYCFD